MWHRVCWNMLVLEFFYPTSESLWAIKAIRYDYVVYNLPKKCFEALKKSVTRSTIKNSSNTFRSRACAERNSARLWWIIQAAKCACYLQKKWPNQHLYPSGKMPGSFEAAPHTEKHTGGSCCRHTHTCVAGRDIANYLLAERLNYQLQLLSSLCIHEFSSSQKWAGGETREL